MIDKSTLKTAVMTTLETLAGHRGGVATEDRVCLEVETGLGLPPQAWQAVRFLLVAKGWVEPVGGASLKLTLGGKGVLMAVAQARGVA